jgi:hypothetical protein
MDDDPLRNPYAPPQKAVVTVVSVERPGDDDPTVTDRNSAHIAGLMLIAAAALNALALVKANSMVVRATYSTRWFSVAYDLFFAYRLLTGDDMSRAKARLWVFCRAVVGALVIGVPLLLLGARIDGILTLASCVGVALLAYPNPTATRVKVGVALFGFTFLVGLLALCLVVVAHGPR